MKLTEERVRYVAGLANLALTEAEIHTYTHDLSDILTHIDKLNELNKTLKVEKTFRLQKMVDYMDADEREIAKIETYMDVSGKFWVKFGFLVARKLAEKSVETNLPVVLG